MDYKLAKRLKGAGFPQSGRNVELDGYGNLVPVEITETDGITDPEVLDKMRLPGPTYLAGTDVQISGKGIIPVHPCYVPTLSELIAACGMGFRSLSLHSDGRWIAKSGHNALPTKKLLSGSSPEEAVVRLFLELNKK